MSLETIGYNFDNEIWLHKWRGYSSHFCGSYYGNKLILGDEKKFYHCFDFIDAHGVSTSYWIKEELDKLSVEEQDELEAILKRNTENDKYKDELVELLSKLYEVDSCHFHRMYMKDLFNALTETANIFKKYIYTEKVFDGEFKKKVIDNSDIEENSFIENYVDSRKILDNEFSIPINNNICIVNRCWIYSDGDLLWTTGFEREYKKFKNVDDVKYITTTNKYMVFNSRNYNTTWLCELKTKLESE